MIKTILFCFSLIPWYFCPGAPLHIHTHWHTWKSHVCLVPGSPVGSHDLRLLSVRWLNNSKNSGSYLTKNCMINLLITYHIPSQWQPQLSSVEVVPDNNVSFLANILNQTMDCPLRWRHVSTCCRVSSAYCAYVTIRVTLGDTCFASRHFVNKVSVPHLSAENKQESAEFYSQHLLMHSRDVIWKIKSKFTFPVSFSLVNADMNLVGNYRTLRCLRTVNPEGLPSTKVCSGHFISFTAP